MSSLYEALRKAELEQNKKGVFTPQVQDKSSNAVPRILVIAVLVVLVLGAILGAYRLWTESQHQAAQRVAAQRQAEEKKAALAVVVAQPAAVAAPAIKVRAPGTYGLDGVIYAGRDSLAVINGKYLKTGEKIDHLVVQKIRQDSVEVLNTNDNSVQTFPLGQ
jgi:hypothetical protein